MNEPFEMHRAYLKANDFVVAHLKFDLFRAVVKPEIGCVRKLTAGPERPSHWAQMPKYMKF